MHCTAWQWNSAYINLASCAKSLGKSAEDAGSFAGEMARLLWNKEGGFDNFVNNMSYIWITFNPEGTVEILEQSEDKIVSTILI